MEESCKMASFYGVVYVRNEGEKGWRDCLCDFCVCVMNEELEFNRVVEIT